MIEIDLYKYFYDLVKQIPEGRITTYKELALALGDIIASRAVGQMLAENPTPIIVPCHRVIRSDGTIGGFTHPEGLKKKIELLKKENVEIVNDKVLDFEKLLFKDFKTDYPLLKIKEEEKKMLNKIKFDDIDFENIVAVDVSYQGRNAYLSFVYINENLEILDIKNYKDFAIFPYIPTYFSYREGNMIIRHYRGKDLLILDGNGIIHPRGFGLATYVGIFLDVPTIGMAKSLLYGKILDDKIYSNGKQIGWFINKKVISQGNHISLNKTFEVSKKLLEKGDPIKFAHKFSNIFRVSEQQRQSQ